MFLEGNATSIVGTTLPEGEGHPIASLAKPSSVVVLPLATLHTRLGLRWAPADVSQFSALVIPCCPLTLP